MSQEQPLVSVIMAACNGEAFIGEAIESILAQTYPNLELLVVDDASTDRTAIIARRYAEGESRVRVFANETRRGAAATRNRALREARGELIAILDADDVALPHRLETTVPVLLGDSRIGAVGTRAITIDEAGVVISVDRWRPTNPRELRRRLWDGYAVLVHSSSVMRAAVMRELGGYDEFFRSSHDFDLWVRMLERHEIRCLPEPVVKYRVGQASICAQNAVDQAAYKRLSLERARRARRGEAINLAEEFERFHRLEERANPSSARAFLRLAHLYLEGGDRLEARRWSLAALRANPRSPHNLSKYLLTWAPDGLLRTCRAAWTAARRRGR